MNYTLPGYTATDNAYKNIGKIVSPFGKKITIIGGETALDQALDLIVENLSGFIILDTIIYGKEATMKNAEILCQKESVYTCDIIFAVGGGKALDTCKVVASKLEKPIFTFPTLASNCSAMTKECIMYNDKGMVEQVYYMQEAVKHVFINEKIIRNSPYFYFHAGVGTAICKAFEPVFKARRVQTTYEDALALNMCVHLKDDIFMYGNKALKFFSDNEETHNLILDIIVTSGYISILLNPSLNKGIPHAIYNSMTKIFGFEKLNYYGDAITFGLLVNLIYEKSNEMYRVFDFLKDNGYPVKLINLKLKFDNINMIGEDSMNEQSILDYPKSITSHDITRGIILLEEDFLLNTF